MMKALYYHDARAVTQKDIEDALTGAGLTQGDTVMIHSDVGSFGKLGDVRDENEFLGSILDAFINVITRDGTLIVPTYSYSFCNHQVFDVVHTDSTVGIFTNFIRRRPQAVRSEDPIFSHAGIGRHAEHLLNHVGRECFGTDSFFDRFYKFDGKIVNFGKFFDITFLHYIEKHFRVDYRYDKTFSGTLVHQDGHRKEVEVVFYVHGLPSEGCDVEYNMTLLGDELEQRHLLRKMPLGNDWVRCSRARDCYQVGMDMLRRNPYAFLKKIPFNDHVRSPV